ncbi:MAG: methyl-accepting chemotaxis protein [Bacteroidota bacterium]
MHTSIIDQSVWLVILQFIAIASLNTFNWIKTLNFVAQNNTLIGLGIPTSLYINTEQDGSKSPVYSEYPEKEENSKSREAFIQFSEKISPLKAEINKNVTTLKNSYQEQSTGLKELVTSLSEMRRNTKENNRHAQFAKKISQNAVLMVDEMTQNSIESLEFIEQISQKINIVTDIARQTRILSLNASIEAARAGEHGKGFAVIAEEIKKLSENSRKAADEIIKLSEATVTSTEKTKNTAENLAPEVQNSSALLEDTAMGTKELAGNFKKLMTFIQNLEDETQIIKEEAETAISNVESLNELSNLFQKEIESGENQEHFSDEYNVSWS